MDIPSSGGNRVLSVNAKPDVVVYADLSADVDNNQDALSRLISARKGRALSAAQAAEIINAAAADTVSPDPRGVALKQLRQLADQVNARASGDSSEIELRLIISDLEPRSLSSAVQTSQQRSAEAAFLRDYASKRSKDADVVSAHSLIRRAN
jgi:hypothetical protein